jgi:signal transduction histidine kinase
MTTPASDHAQIDGEGCLVSADSRLAALNARAGGAVGKPLAIPQLESLARLAQLLRIPISRRVIAADGDRDLDLWVEAKAAGDGVDLVVGGWAVRPQRASWLAVQPLSDVSAVPAQDWRWTCDATLKLTGLILSPDEVGTLRASDVVGAPLTRLVRLIENGDGDLPILAALASATAFADQRAVRRDRPEVEIALAGSPLFDEAGRLIGFTGVASAAAASAVADVAPLHDPDFAARLGQALRAPLDRIVARAETIGAQTEGPLRRDYADYAGDIASAGRHLLALVDDLADLEAVERVDFAIDREPVDLADVARRAAGLLAVRAADRQIRIDRPDTDERLIATGDFRRVLQILVNLVSNAVRYTPPGGMVWLRTEREADSAVVIVADQGKGIAEADHARVFAKFERVDPSEPGGSGLGLYISRRLARAMGGDITLDSAPGQGARFVLTLPVA